MAATDSKRQRIRVCLRSYDHRLVDASALRSPHVDKKSREHFEIRTHKRIIDIYEPTQQTTEELSRLDLPAGVDIEVKL